MGWGTQIGLRDKRTKIGHGTEWKSKGKGWGMGNTDRAKDGDQGSGEGVQMGQSPYRTGKETGDTDTAQHAVKRDRGWRSQGNGITAGGDRAETRCKTEETELGAGTEDTRRAQHENGTDRTARGGAAEPARSSGLRARSQNRPGHRHSPARARGTARGDGRERRRGGERTLTFFMAAAMSS